MHFTETQGSSYWLAGGQDCPCIFHWHGGHKEFIPHCSELAQKILSATCMRLKLPGRAWKAQPAVELRSDVSLPVAQTHWSCSNITAWRACAWAAGTNYDHRAWASPALSGPEGISAAALGVFTSAKSVYSRWVWLLLKIGRVGVTPLWHTHNSAAVPDMCYLCFPMQWLCFNSLASKVWHLNLYISIWGELVWFPALLCPPSCSSLQMKLERGTGRGRGMVLLHEMQTVAL